MSEWPESESALATAIAVDLRESAVRSIVHDWIRESLPLAGKMNLLPQHVENLVQRLTPQVPPPRLTPAEEIARIIVGPRKPVPAHSQYTLAALREVRWKMVDRNHRNDAMNAAQAIIEAMGEGDPA